MPKSQSIFGGQRVTAIITCNACKDLGLKKGVRAFALMKATEVMVIADEFSGGSILSGFLSGTNF